MTVFDDRAKEKLFEALEAGYSLGHAAKHASTSTRTIRRHRDKDEAFAAAYQEAYEVGTDALEDEARRRAVDGVEQAVFYQGEKLKEGKREYSDVLLIFILKARRPDKYRERSQIEHIEDSGLADRILKARSRLKESEPISADDDLLA